MTMKNKSKMTDAEIVEIVALALIARRTHNCRRVKDESEVAVHDGIHTQFDTHSVLADVEGMTVHFFRHRQHSPCKGLYHHEVSEPYGFDGVEIEASDVWITVRY